tara:strand:- start:505 stop:633 length:129 start_codon:yes stop_codon:yes gene_type:complete
MPKGQKNPYCFAIDMPMKNSPYPLLINRLKHVSFYNNIQDAA